MNSFNVTIGQDKKQVFINVYYNNSRFRFWNGKTIGVQLRCIDNPHLLKSAFELKLREGWIPQSKKKKVKEYGKKIKEDKITESEVETAQVVLAAQDMVDKIAGWMEDVADMQYKDLPGLVEMMRNEVGVNEAQAFLDAQTATLSTLMTSLEQAKAESTTAMAPLTGEQAVDPSEFSNNDLDLDAGVDNDTPPEADSDGDITEPDLEPDLGRERR